MEYKKKMFFILFFLSFSTFVHSNVVTSVKPIGFIVSAITDNLIPVEVLLPHGASEHNYVLKPSDIQRLKNADLIVWIDPAMENFLSKSILKKNKSLQLSELDEIKKILYDERKIEQHQNKKTYNINKNYYNMHFWLSPKIAIKTAEAIYERLLYIMPKQKENLKKNLEDFKKKLEQTNQKISYNFSQIKNKKYFVFHNAFSYFEKYFGLSPEGYFKINPNIQLGAKSLYKIKNTLLKKKVICVFSEPQLNTRFIDIITRRNISIKRGILDPLGINIDIKKDSYIKFLLQLSNQYLQCLKNYK